MGNNAPPGANVVSLPQELLRRRRDGERLSPEEITGFVTGIARGDIGDAQVAAFCMTAFYKPLDMDETVALTRAMTDTGERLSWTHLAPHGPILDKHSTGGVGDNVSLALAPMIAACGGFVPMISGRGLGHTGGTLDKLESIPGYQIRPDARRLNRALRDAGCAIIGQSETVAPVDRRMYAIRDVTATVEPMALIVASILSKKLAAGLDALVLDVKCGNGAFMPDAAAAQRLARALSDVANAAGLATTALLTNMDMPLARTAGNALELRHALGVLTGYEHDAWYSEVLLSLGARLLLSGGLAAQADDARKKLLGTIDSGAAAECFSRMTQTLGGPADLLERLDEYLPPAPRILPVPASRAGFVRGVDTRALGIAVVELGGGRKNPADTIDHRVGLAQLKRPGDPVAQNEPLCVIHAIDEAGAQAVRRQVLAAYDIGDRVTVPESPILQSPLPSPTQADEP